jgi:hypothetical protein
VCSAFFPFSGLRTRVSASTVSDLNQKIYGKINEWRERAAGGRLPRG